MITTIVFFSALLFHPLAEAKLLPPNKMYRVSAVNNGETINTTKGGMFRIALAKGDELYLFDGECFCDPLETTLCPYYKILRVYKLENGDKVFIIKNSKHFRKIAGRNWHVDVKQPR